MGPVGTMSASGATIRSVEVLPLRLRLRRPFVTTSGVRHHVESVLVRLATADGTVGWGEAVPDEAVTGEPAAATLAALRGPLSDAVVGVDLDGGPRSRDEALSGSLGVRAAPRCPAARAAVDIALHDLAARRAGIPLHVLLARRVRTPGFPPRPLTVSRVVGMAAPDVMAAAARRHVDDGFSTLKVKVGDPVDWALDVERVAAVRSAVGDRIGVKVDVNEGWRTVDVAVAALEAMRGSAPLFVEQPVDRLDVEGLAEIRRRVPEVAIMADEAVAGEEHLHRLLEHDAVDLVNIKLMRVGGLGPASRMVDAAASAGVGVQIGTMLESSVGSAAGLHLASASGDVSFVEMGGPLLLAEDVGNLADFYDGERVTLPAGPGLGLVPTARTGT